MFREREIFFKEPENNGILNESIVSEENAFENLKDALVARVKDTRGLSIDVVNSYDEEGDNTGNQSNTVGEILSSQDIENSMSSSILQNINAENDLDKLKDKAKDFSNLVDSVSANQANDDSWNEEDYSLDENIEQGDIIRDDSNGLKNEESLNEDLKNLRKLEGILKGDDGAAAKDLLLSGINGIASSLSENNIQFDDKKILKFVDEKISGIEDQLNYFVSNEEKLLEDVNVDLKSNGVLEDSDLNKDAIVELSNNKLDDAMEKEIDNEARKSRRAEELEFHHSLGEKISLRKGEDLKKILDSFDGIDQSRQAENNRGLIEEIIGNNNKVKKNILEVDKELFNQKREQNDSIGNLISDNEIEKEKHEQDQTRKSIKEILKKSGISLEDIKEISNIQDIGNKNIEVAKPDLEKLPISISNDKDSASKGR